MQALGWKSCSFGKSCTGTSKRDRSFLGMAMSRQKLHFMVRKQVRGDGLPFWLWEVVDACGWTLVSGTVYGPRSRAVEKARATILACENPPNAWGRKAS